MGLFKGINIGANGLKFAFAIVGVILSALIVTKWDEKLQNVDDIMPSLDASVTMVFIGIGICFAVWILFGSYQFITNIKRNKGGLIGLIVFAGIVLVSIYGLAKSNLMDYREYRGGKFADPEFNYNDLTDTALQLSEGGLYGVYILIGLAVLAAIVAEVTKIIK